MEKTSTSKASTSSKSNRSNGSVMVKETETVQIGLERDAMDGVAEILTRALADTEVVYVKTLDTHWNIVGRDFYGAHLLLDEQYNALKAAGDELAERIRSYGRPAIGSMSEFLANTRLQERTDNNVVTIESLQDLVNDHEAIVRQLRDDIERCDTEYKDQGAMDLLIKHLQIHQEMAWFLRSFLQ